MASREELQYKLEEILGSRNVYYQPPESKKINYPAIIYKRNDIGNVHANNRVYSQRFSYQLTVITELPDHPVIFALSKMRYCSFNSFYVADNLNHYVFTLYY